MNKVVLTGWDADGRSMIVKTVPIGDARAVTLVDGLSLTDDSPPTPDTSAHAATPGTSVMAGAGWYNDHSAPQHVAGDDGLPLLRNAAESVPLNAERGVLVADYGSSQGRNSAAAKSSSPRDRREAF
jgi:hypothetical protein